MSCRAKGVFHVTVPAPPKVSIFKTATESLPSVVIQEDSSEINSFIIPFPPEAFQRKSSEGVIQKSCSEMIAVTSSDETLVQSSSIVITDVEGGCQISYSPNPNASGVLDLIATSTDSPTDTLHIPITITNINDAPTDLSLSSLSLAENAGENPVVGNLSATDPDQEDTFTYSLVAGAGSTDNNAFNILSNQLRMTSSADFETQSSYEIRLRVTEQDGLFFEKPFTISITNVNEAPVLSAIGTQTTPEDNAVSVALTAFDVDGSLSCSGANLLYSSSDTSLVAATGAVSWSGTWPSCSAFITPVLNAFGEASLTITWSDGILSSSQTFLLNITQVNDPPVISDVTNQTTTENTTLNAVSVSISDPDSVLTCSSLSAISSDTTLIPSANVTFSGTAPNCLISLAPALNQTGSSTITLTVSDTLLTATDTFMLTVNAVNDAPTISDVTDKATAEDTALTGVAVTIADFDSVLACASLSASSSNTALIPSANITVSGTAPNCLVSLTPALNQTGSSTITLTVIDDTGLTATDTFMLTVNAVNDAPTISDVTDKATAEDTALTGVAVTIADVDSVLTCASLSASSSNTALIPGANITVSGTAPNCLVSLTPALNQTGSSTITLTVIDDTGLTATDTFMLTVNAVNDAPTISDVTDKATAEDNALTGIAVTIADFDSVLACASLSASSSNTALISGANITVSGTAPNCLVSLTPALNQTGSSTITLTVSDTLLTATDTFVLTVNAVNDAPTISDVTDKATAEDTALTGVVVTIADVDSVLTCSSLTASSSNTALIPGAIITVSGTAPNCLVSLTPALNQTGSSTITLTVSDTSITATDSFILTVNAVNDAPVLSAISSQSTSQDTPTSAIAITITDVDGPDQTCNETYLSYSSQNPAVVSSAGAITWAGTWPSCTAVVTPVIGATGISMIEITVSDGTLTSLPQSFNLQVSNSVGWFQEAYLKASNADAVDYFGYSVSISGDTAIVAAFAEASNQTTITNGGGSSANNTASAAGASYIYKRNGTISTGYSWAQEAYLKASNANVSDYFGYSVSISGDTAIVGAFAEDSNQTTITNGGGSSADNTASQAGASYIYKRTGTISTGYIWAQEAYLKASNADAGDNFGTAVSISGDTAIVAAFAEASNQTTITNGGGSSANNTASAAGASYIYKRNGTISTGYSWAQEAYLKASNANVSDYFGYSVSISGDTAIVGATGEDSNQTTITNGGGSSADNTTSDAGASYIYKRTGSLWAQEAYLKASNANAGDNFGTAVSISGDTAIVGAHWEDSNQTTITNGGGSSADNSALQAGASYIYKRTGTLATGYSWAQEVYLKASNTNADHFFGRAVALSGDTAIVGTNREDSNQTTITNGGGSSADNTASNAGASYIYKRTGSVATGYRWAQEAYLKASNANVSDLFGYSVSISGDTAIVGAYGEASNQTTITNGGGSSGDNSATNAGASYIYRNLSRIFEPDLRVSDKTSTSITLSWGSNLGTATQVIIAPAVLSDANPPACTDSGATTLNPGVTSYTYSGLTAATKYGFRVCAYDGTNVSEGAIIREDTAP